MLKGSVLIGLLMVFCFVGFARVSAENNTAQSAQQENFEDGYAVYYKVNLHLGICGEDVKLLQSYLTRFGYFRDEVNGKFGLTTVQAVKEFQKAAGLTVDGIAGPQTFRALKEYGALAVSRGAACRNGAKDMVDKNSMCTSEAVTAENPQANIAPRWRPIQLEATAYTRYDAGCGNWTYRGNYLQRGLVAVDPGVIPLGTRLYVPGYGFAIADDIGRAIKGYRIDLAMDTRTEAFAYGRRKITAYIIDGDTT